MYPVAGPVLTVPVTLVTSFFMLGIEDAPPVIFAFQMCCALPFATIRQM